MPTEVLRGARKGGVRKGGAREPHRSLPPSSTSGGFLDRMGASDFDPAAVRAQAQFPRTALVRRFPGLCFSRVTSVSRIPVYMRSSPWFAPSRAPAHRAGGARWLRDLPPRVADVCGPRRRPRVSSLESRLASHVGRFAPHPGHRFSRRSDRCKRRTKPHIGRRGTHCTTDR